MMQDNLIAETMRYLGIHDGQPDDSLRQTIEQAISRVEDAAQKQAVKQKMACRVEDPIVWLGSYAIHSADLAKHLMRCDEVLLFAATLGAQVDRLLMRDTIVSPSLAVVEQAAAAALVENYCDACCREYDLELGEGLHLKPRFSPGYGDFSLEEQSFLLDALQANKRMGLTHTSSYMLAPAKSVTAVIGITKGASRCYAVGCQMCSLINCAFRKR